MPDVVDLGGISRPRFFDLIGDAITTGEIGDLFFGAGDADGLLVEGIDVGLQFVGCVAVGVNADEQNTYVLGVVAKLFEDGGKLRHGGGTDVGATGVAEKQHDGLAFQVFAGDSFSACARQLKLQVWQVAFDVVEGPVDGSISAGGEQGAGG